MARKISSSTYGSSTPKITQEDLEADIAVMTIASFDEVEVDDAEAPNGKRKSPFLTFTETGEKVLWLNKTQIDSLITALGDDVDQWIGEAIPVQKHTAMYAGKKFPKVIVCPAEDWVEYLGKKNKRPAIRGKR